MPIVLAGVAGVPGVPVLTAASPLDGAVVAVWDPPTIDGGSAITGYLVTAVDTATGTLAATLQVNAGVTSVTLPLANDAEYSVTVAATNGVGSSARSNAILATPTGGAGVAPLPDEPAPLPYAPVPQPMVDAFPMDRPFRPGNWLLSAEEVDAL